MPRQAALLFAVCSGRLPAAGWRWYPHVFSLGAIQLCLSSQFGHQGPDAGLLSSFPLLSDSYVSWAMKPKNTGGLTSFSLHSFSEVHFYLQEEGHLHALTAPENG